MDKVLGFIGCGNMGQAMIGGIIEADILSANQVIVADLDEDRLAEAKEEYGIRVTTNNQQAAATADILVLAVKPKLYPVVINEIKDSIKDTAVIVTIAAGVEISKTEEMFDKEVKVVRIMPNTPALVGAGMSALATNDLVTESELEEVNDLFASFGKTELVSEELMDVVTSTSGSAPAYVFLFIEALADGAVLDGLARDKAYKLAAQTVFGAAKMVLETDMHPGELKDMVCSPGGTTIEAVATLEEEGFRQAIVKAAQACTEKSKKMSQQ
ncbi:pyrroline-5-carboxylate reductase [Halanaerobaculum tunisiense]